MDAGSSERGRADGEARVDATAAGFGQGEDAAATSARALKSDVVERVRRAKFSWLSRKVLIESRNDQFAKYIHDVVLDERPRWIAAQRAAGVENACPDFRIDRKDLGAFTCLLLGDPGEGDISQWAVARALPMGAADSHFMVLMSDVVYAAGDVNQYVEKFYEPYGRYPHVIYALPGNHDWYDGLDGFMFHFCGSEALARVSYRTGSLPVREWLARVLWRKASRPDRKELMGRRASRPPFDRDPARPPQPAPYWCLETQHVALVAIDTGITGTIDHEQGDWLLRLSRKVDKPKVLLTGKPLYANNEYAPCAIKWGGGVSREFRTVDEVVRHREFGYVAAIGGDIHNYQRYPVPVEGGTIQYIVSGGAGAYMSQTHEIDRADRLEGPAGNAGITEADTRLHPLRGDSLAMYTQQLAARAPMWVAQSVLGLLATVGLIWLLSGWSERELWRPGALVMGVGVLQLGYALLAPRERLRRIAAYAATLLVVGLAVVLFDREWRSGLSDGTVTVVLVVGALALPALCVAVGGWQARRFAVLLAVLAVLALATWLLMPSTIQTAVEIVAVSLAAAAGCVALRAAAAGKRGARAAVPLAGALAAAGLAALFLAWDFRDVLGWILAVLAALGASYVLALGLIPTAVTRRGRRIDDDARLVNHAAKFLAVRFGMSPVRPAAGAVDRVDPSYEKLFNRMYPRGKLWRLSPFHRFASEILDFDQPPLAKHFLELEVRTPLIGSPQLLIRCYGVSGLPLGERTLVEEVGPIPLTAP